MADIRFGAPSSWADAFAAADFNALANNGGKLSTATAVSNGTGRYIHADVSFIMVTSTVSPTGSALLALYLLPLLHDGSSYPDNEDTTTAANLAATAYLVGSIGFRTKATQSIKGGLTGILVPPGTFKWYMVNRLGVALPSSSTNMTCQYRLYGYEAA